MKWRLALRRATSPSERWLMKAAEWNPELSSKYKTNRAIVRPRKRWEDDINEFLKFVEDETENYTESSSQINKTWINTAKDRGRWTLLEENYTTTSEERQENNARMRVRRNNQSRPARYVNGVESERRRSGQHHITQSLKKTKVKSEMKFLQDAAAPQSVPHASPK